MCAASAALRSAPPEAARPTSVVERFSLASAKERWIDFVALEHETLPPPVAFERDGDAFLVFRRPGPGRPIRDGRVPRELIPQLLLQGAAATAFFQSHGVYLEEEDLAAARWDRRGGAARLWLAGSPLALSRATPRSGACRTLLAFLDRLARRGGRIADPEARALAERLGAPDAALRRAEFAVAAVARSFASLADPASAPARRRAAGYAGSFLRDAGARTLAAAAGALVQGRQARVFSGGSAALRGGGALGLDPLPSSVTEASRRLRELARADASRGGAIWIAGSPERWDDLSRRAFEMATRSLPTEIEVQVLAPPAPPRLPDEWRREVFVPCGTVGAALRFYEWLADEARERPASAREIAQDFLAGERWAAFVSDPTGQAPLPLRGARGTGSGAAGPRDPITEAEREILTLLEVWEAPVETAEIARLCGRPSRAALRRLAALGHIDEAPWGWRLTASGRLAAAAGEEAAVFCRRWAEREKDPGRRIDLLLSAGAPREALAAAKRWHQQSGPRPAEAWFTLAARLRAASVAGVPWLDAIEAEREIAGGRPAEALMILERTAQSPSASQEERRVARLRAAEIAARVEGISEAGRRAARWREEFREAPPSEMTRALRLEAAGLARAGRYEPARERLDEADRRTAGLDEIARLENDLARASVLSSEGRFDEESQVYERWRAKALELGDDTLAARFLSQEALGLCDRRRFSEAASRLEEGLAVLRDDAAERSRLSIDLAATLYHAGRPERCADLLEEAAGLAASAGRRDLLRIARSNRIELQLSRGDWDAASAAAEEMLEAARRADDELWTLVALHHRARLALRRGRLEQAAEDNARARDLAERLQDRLEIGELWLEEGDRLLYVGDAEGARRAWESAAADPPDRCDTERLAASRLAELAWAGNGGPPGDAREALGAGLLRGAYEAAETAARWRMLFGEEALGKDLGARAERILRGRGGEALADRVFGRREAGADPGVVPIETVRGLREALARALAGEGSSEDLEALGLAGVALADAEGREVMRLGRLSEAEARAKSLEAGETTYRLKLPAQTPEALAAVVGLLIETLLFRRPAGPASEGFAAAWRRLGIVTEDASMEEPYRRLQRFAAQPVTVLVRGESGSGKEAVARAVHALSPRAAGPFVAVNVPAIPAALLESELFGHARGAFTGAERDRVGLLEEAARGTIFFDEIGDLEAALQSKLLRALQDREIRRLGENRSRRIDVRVVSATSRDLAREVEAGRFREDLYYRLHVAVIALPPLRERGRDSLRLARHFLDGFAREYRRGPLRLSPEAALALGAHAWPGNVRELQNAMAQAAALAEPDGVIGLAHLPEALASARPRASSGESYRSRLDAHRKEMISDALERARGNRSLAARDLGLSRQALRYLIKELRVDPPSPGANPRFPREGRGRRAEARRDASPDSS